MGAERERPFTFPGLINAHEPIQSQGHAKKLGAIPPYRLRIIDASNIQEPGSTGTDWRLHYSIRLPELTCDHYELTDDQGGGNWGRVEGGWDGLKSNIPVWICIAKVFFKNLQFPLQRINRLSSDFNKPCCLNTVRA